MSFNIPPDYLIEPDPIPDFWITDLDDIDTFLSTHIKKGTVETIGHSAGGRPIRAVTYGTPRGKKGSSTFSGSLGSRNVRTYLGDDADAKVYMAMGGVHGSEYEGIVGIVNLLAILETGKDLRGKAWPEITQAAESLDRMILIPIVNVDGRARLPIRMESHRGTDKTVHQFFTTGAWADGKLIGWPACKAFIPLDFEKTQFPGAYPNDAGVNIQHDDFLGTPQPETRLLLDLTDQERPDIILNMHTGAPPKNYYQRMHRPFIEDALNDAFENLYRRTHTRLTLENLQSSSDPDLESRVPQKKGFGYNLDTILNLHCGALPVLIEAPCQGFSGTNREGEIVLQTPDMTTDAQLICHQEAMGYLNETGGRVRWADGTPK